MIGRFLNFFFLIFTLSCTPNSSTTGDFVDKEAVAIILSTSPTDPTSMIEKDLHDSEALSLFAFAVDSRGEIVGPATVTWSLENELGELSEESGNASTYQPTLGEGADIIKATHNSLGEVSFTVNMSYTVTETNGLVLWLKADGGVVTSGADQVLQWMDLSGNDKSAVQGGGDPQKPRLIDSGQNQRPVVRFDGVSEFLSGTSVVSGASARTIFIVFKAISQPNTYNVPIDLSQVVAGSGTNYALTTELGVRVSGFRAFSSSLTTGEMSLVVVQNGVSENVTATQMFLDGVSLSGGASASASISTSSSGYFIGKAAFTSSSCHCDIAEVIVYEESVSNANRIEIQDYLQEKWGL